MSPTSATPGSTRSRQTLSSGHDGAREEVDDDDKPLGLRPQQQRARGADDDGDDDGKAIRDDADGDEDEGLIGRSGATGGSVFGALGRALTVRRTGSTKARPGRRREGEQAGPANEDHDDGDASTGLHLPAGLHLPTIDANEVKAGLDWSKTK